MSSKQDAQIESIPDLRIVISEQRVELPTKLLNKINQHWRGLVHNNPGLWNGEAFTVTAVKKAKGRAAITLAETDYAHYLYSHQVGGLGEYDFHVVHPAALVISTDGKFIFGSMGEHTSRPRVIQCCGGGIDYDDIKDGTVDIGHNVAKELAEELGLDVGDASVVAYCRPAYLKSNGPSGTITIVYVLQLKQSAQAFLDEYERFVRQLKKQGEDAEFSELFSLQATPDSIEEFITQHQDRLDEYMPITLRRAQKDLSKRKSARTPIRG